MSWLPALWGRKLARAPSPEHIAIAPEAPPAPGEMRLTEGRYGPWVEVMSDDGRLMAVAVTPYRCRTHLIIHDVASSPRTFYETTLPPTSNEWVRSVAEFISSGVYYHWDTPRYRELCEVGGLDPDRGRPVFKSEFKEAGEKLVIEMNSRNDNNHNLWLVIFDVIDIMRTDIPDDPNAVANLRHKIAYERKLHPALVDDFLEVLTRLGIDVGQLTPVLARPQLA